MELLWQIQTCPKRKMPGKCQESAMADSWHFHGTFKAPDSAGSCHVYGMFVLSCLCLSFEIIALKIFKFIKVFALFL